MSYSDRTPIREALLARVVPLIEAHHGRLTVLDYDIQFTTWVAGQPQPRLITAWSFVVITAGALLGADNYLDYTWTFGERPQVPTDTDLEAGVKQAFQRLSLMLTRQLQNATPNGPTAN